VAAVGGAVGVVSEEEEEEAEVGGRRISARCCASSVGNSACSCVSAGRFALSLRLTLYLFQRSLCQLVRRRVPSRLSMEIAADAFSLQMPKPQRAGQP
jgi:hypothetical protein